MLVTISRFREWFIDVGQQYYFFMIAINRINVISLSNLYSFLKLLTLFSPLVLVLQTLLEEYRWVVQMFE